MAVAVVAPGRVEGIAIGRARVDGSDATERIRELVEATGQSEGLRALLVDGIAVAGFNLIDLPKLSRGLGLPVIAVTPRKPDLPAMRSAIRKYFPGEARRRGSILSAAPVFRAKTPGGPIWAAVVGAPRSSVGPLLQRTVLRGRWPEVLGIARRIARAVAKARVPGARRRPKDYRPGGRRAVGPVA